ncbi:hypothetical protein Tco_0884861 [Tanacetum coccineum]
MKSLNMKLPSIVLSKRGYKGDLEKLDVAMKMWKRFVEVEVAAVPTSKPDPLRPNLGVLQVVSRAKVPETPASNEELDSPTSLSPGYIADFDPDEDEEDPADHPINGGDNDDNESSNDDDDDDDDVRRIRRTRRKRNT